MDALVDNDVLLKAVSYGLAHELLGQFLVGVLGAAQYVVRKKVQSQQCGDTRKNRILDQFHGFMEVCIVVEPTDEELTMAADFELAAQRQAVPLDSGESQLCAVLLHRALPELLPAINGQFKQSKHCLTPNIGSRCYVAK